MCLDYNIMNMGVFHSSLKVNIVDPYVNFVFRTVFFVYSFNFDPTVRHTFWALTFGGMINWVGTFGASQQSIQRFSALPSLREAKM